MGKITLITKIKEMSICTDRLTINTYPLFLFSFLFFTLPPLMTSSLFDTRF